MCGLAFLFAPHFTLEERQERMNRALDRLQHRGPDEAGILNGTDITFGHRRLSIIDLATSHQPMVDSTKRFTLCFNGEIYNYQELRQALVSRWTFTTEGDTEVLLAGLILEGLGFLEHLEGMWAFVLWDEQRQRLLLSRDRLGKKPLYYRFVPEGIIGASELPALRVLDSEPWTEDFDSTADYLRYGYFLPGFTAYREVREVLPGHTLHLAAR